MTTCIIDELPESLYDLLNHIGVPQHLKGYQYLAYAIHIAAANPDKLDQVTKVLYPEVAEAFGTIPSRVERAMRHAIECVFDNAEYSLLYEYFGNAVNTTKGKVTNMQFISNLTWKYRRILLSKK